MLHRPNPLTWQIPLTVLACVAASLAGVWVTSRTLGFTTDASAVAVFSAVLSSAMIARELRSQRKHPQHHPAP
ncbi:MAG: hypothetical protein HYV19_06635 [Gemmatimonadetes bacterium]|nr:hypothetical protein [Gemmatimonadota bacterium]